MKLILPWPPSTNTYWRHIAMRGRPRTLLSKEGREYRSRVQERVLQQAPGHRMIMGPVHVSIDAWLPDQRRRDADNLLKATLDALQSAGIYGDDSQISRLLVSKAYDAARAGELHVSIAEAPKAVDYRQALGDDPA